MNDSDRAEALRLLGELTVWQKSSGIDPGRPSDVRSTGESNSAIDDLKRRIEVLGACYDWFPEAAEYRLIDPADCPGAGEATR
ncbi:hypothetical protein [Accumulibacter sp.]|uniref:hypothetical protein n=1 Tax=Accumulibacter sp. TaxID=2053492 RepID=UPI0025EA2B40|nr:hypothetical protein [Accumulibacter sp.]MCM8596505.1 hypothetical protein [Accumulibacter sp.]MCM8627323.1 hypothetical protein [Accumulibacter sp.]MDS4050653.1 hypothetical protein [Accumulibacter sp.]